MIKEFSAKYRVTELCQTLGAAPQQLLRVAWQKAQPAGFGGRRFARANPARALGGAVN